MDLSIGMKDKCRLILTNEFGNMFFHVLTNYLYSILKLQKTLKVTESYQKMLLDSNHDLLFSLAN